MFNYPGVGLLFFNAATCQDYPVLLGVVLIVGVATVVGSLLADIATPCSTPGSGTHASGEGGPVTCTRESR